MSEFTAVRAVRRNVPMLVGIVGPPGAGKTESALRIATGMRKVRGGPIIAIDTEGGRIRQYADDFEFDEVQLGAPYRPSRFLECVRAQVPLKPAAVIIDSISEEHEGEGGVLQMHEANLDRMAGDDQDKRQRVAQAAWIKPKAERRAMVDGFMRIGVPLILTFRAREKTKPIKNDRGKAEPTNIGFVPIAPAEIVFALSLKCLLPPFGQGVPTWQSDKVGEGFLLKLPRHFKPFFEEGKPLSEDLGVKLAEWMKGPAAKSTEDLAKDGAAIAKQGSAALKNWWERALTKEERKALRDELPKFQISAEEADATANQSTEPA